MYGAGLEGEKFYCRYRDKYDIQYYIDKNSNRTFYGIPVYSLEQIEGQIGDCYIFVAIGMHIYPQIKDMLEQKGLTEFNGFCQAEFLDRELAILYGNCHMRVLEKYFRRNPCFMDKYVIRSYLVHMPPDNFPADEELENYGLFISYDIREENSFGVPSYERLRQKVKSTCRCVKVPNLLCSFNSFFPQILGKADDAEILKWHINENAVRAYDAGIAVKVGWIGYSDANICRLYKEGRTIGEIKDFIENADCYSGQDIIDKFHAELEKLKKREQECDIQISDFIEANFQAVQLFYAPNHPTEVLLCELGRRILFFLGFGTEAHMTVEPTIDYDEVFIYGCVKRALGLRFEQKYIRKGSEYLTVRNKPLKLEEYIEDFIAWALVEA